MTSNDDMTPTDDTVETVARAIYEAAPAWASRDSQDRVIRYAEWNDLNERVKGICRDQALAAIEAIEHHAEQTTREVRALRAQIAAIKREAARQWTDYDMAVWDE